MTEWGYLSMQGGSVLHNRDAEYRVRGNLIFQATGARASMPFVGADYDMNYWGLMYRLGAWKGFGSYPLAPKPSIVALAVQSSLLNRATPMGPVDVGSDPAIWAYGFAEGDRITTALWTTDTTKVHTAELSIPVGISEVQVYDIMGHSRVVSISDEQLSLKLRTNVQYVVYNNPTVVNNAPIVQIQEDTTTYPDFALDITAVVSDDGLPNPPGSVTMSWSKVSGPGDVSFSKPHTQNTSAIFSTVGLYVLKLTADDGALSTSDELQVKVLPQGTYPDEDSLDSDNPDENSLDSDNEETPDVVQINANDTTGCSCNLITF